MKFKSHLIKNILNNQGNVIENTIRSIHPSEKVVIAQGYGASSTIPKRFLAYAVPVLRLASQLSENTTIEFYFAMHGVHRANGIYFGDNFSLMRDELWKFVRRYYPDLSQRVRIMEDSPLSVCAENVIEALFPSAQKVMENNLSIKQFVSNRGGENALRYMLEHLLYMRDPILVNGTPNMELLVPKMVTNFNHLIMIGGPSEKIFYNFRQAMLEECGIHTEWKSHQFFTPIGDPPTYHVFDRQEEYDYMIFGDPINFLSELKKGHDPFGKKGNIVRDYITLIQDFAKVEAFKTSNTIDPAVLKEGYANFKLWFHDFQKTQHSLNSLKGYYTSH